jgi:acetyl esterase/lipase
VRRRQGAILAAAVLLALAAVAGCGSEGNEIDFPSAKVDGARVSWGEPSDGNPAGVVMLIHGGGWQPSPSGYEDQKDNAPVFQDEGYATVAVGYDEGAKGFDQVVAVYKAARKRYPGLPICASGLSAGGNLALMLAAQEPDLACVLALSAPTDLTSLAQQDPEGDEAYEAAVTAFGAGKLAKFSPVRYANRIRAKVLLVAAESDPVVPADQSRELAQALPGAELLVLPPGSVPAVWAHGGGVESDATDDVVTRDFDFLQQVTQGS